MLDERRLASRQESHEEGDLSRSTPAGVSPDTAASEVSATRKYSSEDGRDLLSDENRRRDEQRTKRVAVQLKHLNSGRTEETEWVQSGFQKQIADMRFLRALLSLENSTRTAARPTPSFRNDLLDHPLHGQHAHTLTAASSSQPSRTPITSATSRRKSHWTCVVLLVA